MRTASRTGTALYGVVSWYPVVAFIPDPSDSTETTSAAEGIAIDSLRVIYGGEVVPNDLKGM